MAQVQGDLADRLAETLMAMAAEGADAGRAGDQCSQRVIQMSFFEDYGKLAVTG